MTAYLFTSTETLTFAYIETNNNNLNFTIMKTVNELRTELKQELASCSHVNDNTLAAHVNENIQWAWDNWTIDFSTYFEGQEKPERYTQEFMEEWIENEDFEAELQAINE